MRLLLVDDVGFRKYIRPCSLGTTNGNLVTDSHCHQVFGDHHIAIIVGHIQQLIRGNLGGNDMRINPHTRPRLPEHVGNLVRCGSVPTG